MATRLSHGFQSEAYTVHTANGPITLSAVTYGPIAPDELILETAAVSVCATDLKAAAGKFYSGPPMILGHECAGTVLEVGTAARARFAPGDKVVLSYASCRSECPECVVGANAYCRELIGLNFSGCRTDGSTAAVDAQGEGLRGHFFGQSSMGRRIVARADCAVKVVSETTAEEMRLFASLGCGFQTGTGAVFNVAKPPPNSSICIFGAGSVGLAACLAAKLTAPARLVVVDNSTAKLAMLPECIREAVTHVVDSSDLTDEGQLVERLKELTPGGLGFDYALDCVGRGDLVKAGHLALRARGTVISVGGSPDVALQVTLSQHLVRGITHRGTHQGDSVPSVSIPLMIDLWRQGKFPFDKLLTLYEFGELHRAIQDVKDGNVVKPVLVNLRYRSGGLC
ncbi:chaperonin 10-like protein [Lasiosphaeris hirsuta]|uniref:Chaperonin 10-like protein n=1 Tax=Lasiosphaeris hirsuta TaxID=260670 RepID=A0AA40E4U8_9PEZI|nr:chaperonin 10-like protein [Lasiosphaeris hirsuta]